MSSNKKYLFIPGCSGNVLQFEQIKKHIGGNWDAVDVSLYRPEENNLSKYLRQFYKNSIYRPSSANDLNEIFSQQYDVVVKYSGDDPLNARLVYHFTSNTTPVIAIEEGNQLSLNDNLLNFYALPHTKLLTASLEETKRFIQSGQKAESLETVGLSKYQSFQSEPLLNSNKTKKILYATSPLQSQIKHSFEKWQHRKKVLDNLKNISKDHQIIIKLHPRENIEVEAEKILDIIPSAKVLGGDHSIHELLKSADLIINRGNSQICLEAIWLQKPLLIFPQNLRTIFDNESAIAVAKNNQEFQKLITQLISTKSHQQISEAFMQKHYFSSKNFFENLANTIEEVKAIPLNSDDYFLWAVIFLERQELSQAQDAFLKSSKLGNNYAKLALDCILTPSSKAWLELSRAIPYVQFKIEASKYSPHSEAIKILSKINLDKEKWALHSYKPHILDKIMKNLQL
ncbi:MAG: hypothetical protein NE334_17770 [Lentisphaeraceae bacterium]|nr:hypothetical protein [Lentisphaeraceae bacterium]